MMPFSGQASFCFDCEYSAQEVWGLGSRKRSRELICPQMYTHTYVRKNTHARPPVSVPRRARRPATVGSGLRMRTIEGVSFTPKVNFSRNLSFVSTDTVGRPHSRILHCMATQRARPTEDPSPRRVGFPSHHNTAGGRAKWTSAGRARAGAGSGARFV